MNYYTVVALGLVKSKQIKMHRHRCGIEVSMDNNNLGEKFWVPGYSEKFQTIEELRAKLHQDVDSTVDQFIKDNIHE